MQASTSKFCKIGGLLLTLLITASAAAQTKPEHTMFTKYAAQRQAVPVQRPKAIVSPADELYRTRLSRITKGRPNFADHSRVEIWGCGAGCFMFGIANLSTGETYLYPETVSAEEAGRRLMFDVHSNALHVVGMFNERVPADRWYAWNERSLTVIRDTRLPKHCFSPAEDAERLLPTAECGFQSLDERIGTQK